MRINQRLDSMNLNNNYQVSCIVWLAWLRQELGLGLIKKNENLVLLRSVKMFVIVRSVIDFARLFLLFCTI